jgi:hypothetical protein
MINVLFLAYFTMLAVSTLYAGWLMDDELETNLGVTIAELGHYFDICREELRKHMNNCNLSLDRW